MKIKMSLKKELGLSIIIILVLVLLCFKIVGDSKEYDCDNCIVSFKDKRFDPTKTLPASETNATFNEIYQGYLNGDCPIFWDRVNGFMKDGK